MAISAVHAQLAGVQSVTKGNGLLRLISDIDRLRRGRISKEDDGVNPQGTGPGSKKVPYLIRPFRKKLLFHRKYLGFRSVKKPPQKIAQLDAQPNHPPRWRAEKCVPNHQTVHPSIPYPLSRETRRTTRRTLVFPSNPKKPGGDCWQSPQNKLLGPKGSKKVKGKGLRETAALLQCGKVSQKR